MKDLEEIQDMLEAMKSTLQHALVDAERRSVDLAHELQYVGNKLSRIDEELAQVRYHYGV